MSKGKRRVRQALTCGEVAAGIDASPRTVRKWCENNMLLSYRLPSTNGLGDRRILVSSLVAFCNKHGIPVPPEWMQIVKELKARKEAAANDHTQAKD